MLSLAVRSHWKMAYRTTKKAFEVTFKEILRKFKLKYQMGKRFDNLMAKKQFVKNIDRIENE